MTERITTALSDRYRIERELGQGGMATVYLAHDLKHDRDVAIKVLKPELGAILGVERFLAEIKVTANLQHPNLLPLFDSGEADGLLFYVMPFVEGESLRARIDREKQLPIEDAVEIACAIARALDYAHARGVIHRDLKPDNVLLQAGQPLLADFGIALAVSRAGGKRMTESGLSLGTPQYMSPEQAAADRAIDSRSDIYTLGAITYEMLTGDPPHTGSTAQAIVARIMTEVPRPVRASRASVPERVEQAVHRALAKLPADRFETATAFAMALSGPGGEGLARSAWGSSAAPTRRTGIRELVAWVLAIGGIGAAAYLAARHPAPPAAGRFLVELPDSVSVFTVARRSVALSNDGSQLAILGEAPGQRAIYLRRLDDTAAHPVRGTEGASDLGGFSPDGRWFVFTADGVLKKVLVEGGPPTPLVEAGIYGRWSDRGEVVYSDAGAIWIVSSDGGSGRKVTKSDTSRPRVAYRDPDPLPGGEYALITIRPGNVDSTRIGVTIRLGNLDSSRIGVMSLRDGGVTDLGILGFTPHYVAPGRIVYGRTGGRVLFAPLSLRKRTLTGPSSLLLDHVDQSYGGETAFAVAQNGTIAYTAGTGSAALEEMYRVGRDGVEHPLKSPLQHFTEPRVSPLDGRRILVTISPTPQTATRRGLWLFDIAARTLTLLAADSTNMHGEWTRDGSRVVYIHQEGLDSQLVVSRPWDGSGAPTVLARGGHGAFRAISLGPAHSLSAISGPTDILLAPTESLGVTRPFGTPPTNGSDPHVSPSGRLLAYTSDETGRMEVYLQQIPGPGPRVLVSANGGIEPTWSADGATLFYRSPTRMMSATVVDPPALAVTRRDSLFLDSYFPNYDIFPNGDFLMLRGPASASKVFVIVNWPQLASKQSGSALER